MRSRYHGGDEGGGSALVALFGSFPVALSYLMGIQALLSLQFLPSYFSVFVYDMANWLNLSLPQVAGLFFMLGTTFGIVVGLNVGASGD